MHIEVEYPKSYPGLNHPNSTCKGIKTSLDSNKWFVKDPVVHERYVDGVKIYRHIYKPKYMYIYPEPQETDSAVSPQEPQGELPLENQGVDTDEAEKARKEASEAISELLSGEKKDRGCGKCYTATDSFPYLKRFDVKTVILFVIAAGISLALVMCS